MHLLSHFNYFSYIIYNLKQFRKKTVLCSLLECEVECTCLQFYSIKPNILILPRDLEVRYDR